MTHDWTVVRSCNSMVEAELLKSVLESAGIDAQIPDEHALGINPGLTNALGGVRLLVHDDEFARADEVLSLSNPSPD